MKNLEYLEKLKETDNERKDVLRLFPKQVSEWEIEYRKAKALEIIAEELIKHNVTAGCVVTALENIDTALENIDTALRR